MINREGERGKIKRESKEGRKERGRTKEEERKRLTEIKYERG